MSMVIDSSNIFSLTGSTEAASKAYNLARTDYISYQLNYSGTTQNAAIMASSTNVTKAVQATQTVTVSSYANLIGTVATASTTITFGTPANGDTIIFTGLPTDGTVTFTKVASAPTGHQFSTAANLATAINTLTDVSASNTTGTITLTVVTEGTAMNAATVTGTGSFSTLSITFSGGINNGILTINGTQYVQGVDWTAATDNATTATSIASLTPTGITGAAVSAVVTFTNTAYGTVGNTNTISTSDATNLPVGGALFTGGIDALFTKTAHGLIAGLQGQMTTSNALPTGLLTSTNYYVIVLSANTFALASSLANANAGTRIQFTTTGTGNQTFTPVTISQVVKLQQSNDNVTYFDVSGVTVTISSATAASTLWLVTNPPTLWHKIVVTPTAGALNLAVVVCNRNNSITGSAS